MVESVKKGRRKWVWEVSRHAVNGQIYVEASACGIEVRGEGSICVKEPNWIERLLGITMEKKLERATSRMQGFCNYMNEKEAKTEELHDKYVDEVSE